MKKGFKLDEPVGKIKSTMAHLKRVLCSVEGPLQVFHIHETFYSNSHMMEKYNLFDCFSWRRLSSVLGKQKEA